MQLLIASTKLRICGRYERRRLRRCRGLTARKIAHHEASVRMISMYVQRANLARFPTLEQTNRENLGLSHTLLLVSAKRIYISRQR